MSRKRRPESAVRRSEDRVIAVIGGAVLLGGIVLGGYLVQSLRNGYFDARTKGATEPSLLYAAEEPFWFYGLSALMAGMAIVAIAVGWGMMRDAWRGR